jgi:hypothetical protein
VLLDTTVTGLVILVVSLIAYNVSVVPSFVKVKGGQNFVEVVGTPKFQVAVTYVSESTTTASASISINLAFAR